VRHAISRYRHLLLDAVAVLGAAAIVFGMAATVLYAMDTVPGWVTGEPRHVRRATTVEEAERRLRTRLVLPYYFPSTLAWPPSRIRFTVGPPGAAAVTVEDQEGAPRLFLAQTTGPGSIPERLVPEAQILNTSEVSIGSERGTLSRVVEEGAMAWELRWRQDDRTLLMRSRGSVDELIRIARSTREAP
jgi:hypothetical protein